MFTIMETFSEKLNFCINTVYFRTQTSLSDTFSEIFRNLQNDNIDVMSMNSFVGSVLYYSNLTFSKSVGMSKSSAFVPILKHVKVQISMGSIIYLSSVPVIVCCFILVSRILRFPLKNWQVIHILQILLGITSPKQFRTIRQRIIFFTLIILSLKHSSEVFLSLLSITMIDDELLLNTFEEIHKSNLTVYLTSHAYIALYEQEKQDIEEILVDLKPKIHKTDLVDCLTNLLESQNSICISPYFYSMFFIDNYVKQHPDHKSVKVSDASLFEDNVALPFKAASPYVEKFNEILTKMLESGIWEKIITQVKFVRWDTNKNSNRYLFPTQLVIILSIGYVMAVLSFAAELIVKIYRPTKIYIIQKFRFRV